jgi:hypothetical protein
MWDFLVKLTSQSEPNAEALLLRGYQMSGQYLHRFNGNQCGLIDTLELFVPHETPVDTISDK